MGTREKIIEAATQAFAKQGFSGVRIDALVRDAGVNKSTFYYYFKSKQEIFEEVIKHNFYSLQKEIDNKLISCKTPEEKISTFIDVMFSRERQNVLLVIREIIDGGDKFSDEIIKLMSEIRERLHDIIKEGKLKGVFKNDDLSFTIYLIIGITDFYIMTKPFFDSLRESQDSNKVSLIYTDKTKIVKQLKLIVMNFLKGEKQ